MPVLTDLSFELTVDQVLLGQGADPAIIRARRPMLVEAAERALDDGAPLLRPVVAYERRDVKEILHERILLDGGAALTGPLVARQLLGARSVVAMVCTIGPALEQASLRCAMEDPVHSLALYGVGSAAAEALSTAACSHFGQQAAVSGLQTTIPLSPGLDGWPVERGQPEIFRLVDAAAAGVTLLPSLVMKPVKSVSLVIGIGEQFDADARVCDFCAKRTTCTFQSHYG